MKPRLLSALPLLLVPAFAEPALAQSLPYDFTSADALLQQELDQLDGNVAVVLRQGTQELYRFQAGAIDFDTKTRLASVSKTISAGVILSLIDAGTLSPDQRLGDTLVGFDIPGIGEATFADCWGMRHGIYTRLPYEISSNWNLAQSVGLIGLFGSLRFRPGEQLGYSGAGMQSTGQIASLATGLSWEGMAQAYIFGPCDMPNSDYGQFAPNPAVAGGMRSSPSELMNYASMVIGGGKYGNQEVLSAESIERLFTNATEGLPVHNSPFPESAELYPYGEEPDYGFGAWILAQHPATGHVEEIVGAGAWGSYLWIDRRRELTAVLITDIPAGAQTSFTAAMGLFEIARNEIDGEQVLGLSASAAGSLTLLQWQKPEGARGTLLYGSNEPIRNVFQLRSAQLIGRTAMEQATVPSFPYYAATARFANIENRALTPGQNSIVAFP